MPRCVPINPSRCRAWFHRFSQPRAGVIAGLPIPFIVAGCGHDDAFSTAAAPEAASVMTLETDIPRTGAFVAGAAEPYRRSERCFDSSGSVLEVVGLGTAADLQDVFPFHRQLFEQADTDALTAGPFCFEMPAAWSGHAIHTFITVAAQPGPVRDG